MNTNHIPILLEVGRCHSINKAAQNLFLSQPQVSHIIRNVEDEVGFSIFHRTRSGVTATAQGELYLDSLRIISQELAKIQSIPSQFAEQQDICVAAAYSRFLFRAFLDFQQQVPAPGVTDCFLEDMYDEVIEKVVSRQVRLGLIFRFNTFPGLISRQLERYGLESIPLYQGLPTLAFLSRNHPLAKETSLSLLQLRSQPIVYFRGADLEYLNSLLQRSGDVVQLLISDRASLLEAIDGGHYLSLSNTCSEKVSQTSRYIYLPVEGMEYLSEACCIKPRLYELTTREKRFIRFLQNTFCQYYGEQNA